MKTWQVFCNGRLLDTFYRKGDALRMAKHHAAKGCWEFVTVMEVTPPMQIYAHRSAVTERLTIERMD